MIFPPDSFYAALDEEYTLSQGDIISGVPVGIIPAPPDICRSDKTPQPTKLGVARYGPAELVKNADGWQKKPRETIHAFAKQSFAMVVWQDCQLVKKSAQNAQLQKPDNPTKLFAGIAPIRPLSEFGDNEGIRGGQRPPLFYLPAFPIVGLTDEMCVDLRLIWPVQQSLLAARVTTLSPAARLALYDHMFWFFTQLVRPDTIECPSCGNALPTAFLEPPPGAPQDQSLPLDPQVSESGGSNDTGEHSSPD